MPLIVAIQVYHVEGPTYVAIITMKNKPAIMCLKNLDLPNHVHAAINKITSFKFNLMNIIIIIIARSIRSISVCNNRCSSIT